MAQRVQVAVDCRDVVRLADFWAALLDYEVFGGHELWAEHSRTVATYPGEAWIQIVDPDGRGPGILFHSVPEEKVVKNRVHLDVRAPDDTPGDRRAQIRAFVEKAVALGGRKVRDVTDEAGHFAVMEDPEGNEFCIG